MNAPPSRAALRVLAVSASAVGREVFGATFSSAAGFAITVAPSCDAALLQLISHAFDVVVTDQCHLLGGEAVAQLQRLGRVPIIACVPPESGDDALRDATTFGVSAVLRLPRRSSAGVDPSGVFLLRRATRNAHDEAANAAAEALPRPTGRSPRVSPPTTLPTGDVDARQRFPRTLPPVHVPTPDERGRRPAGPPTTLPPVHIAAVPAEAGRAAPRFAPTRSPTHIGADATRDTSPGRFARTLPPPHIPQRSAAPPEASESTRGRFAQTEPPWRALREDADTAWTRVGAPAVGRPVRGSTTTTAPPVRPMGPPTLTRGLAPHELIVVGASTGGPAALEALVRHWPGDLPPVVIAQHLLDGFTASLVADLAVVTDLHVRTAIDRGILQRGVIYVAPAGRHLRIRRRADGLVSEVVGSSAHDRYRPNIDVLFHAAASEVGAGALGVLLTGMGDDGAAGLLALRRAGAATFCEDPETATVRGMPAAAVALGAAEVVAPLGALGALVARAALPHARQVASS